MKTFAAIDVGSYELSMKIFEFSAKTSMKEIDHIRHSIDLGTETYREGKLSVAKVNELCQILREFTEIMKGYKVSAYKAYGTSAIREIVNREVILDQIRQRTGVNIEVLSNSEQRFLDYKSIAMKGVDFGSVIEKGTAIVDIGGGSIQLSLFDKDTLVTTQNMKLGVLRLADRLGKLNAKPSHMGFLLEEMIDGQLAVFKKMFLKDRQIENIIVMDDYLSGLIRRGLTEDARLGYVKADEYAGYIDYLKTATRQEMAMRYSINEEETSLVYVASTLVNCVLRLMDAKLIWAPGVTLCDGIAYEYAEQNRLVSTGHDFEQDIIASTRNISKRYMGSKKRGEILEFICTTIYDSMKKIHGLGKRERLLLRIAALLHDCGKYISIANLGECSYQIVMATEIIGLSHREREIVANVVRYNHEEFEDLEHIGNGSLAMDSEACLTVAKLVAILRVANALDRSHKDKFKDFKTVLKENELVITVNSSEDITLERGLFEDKAEFFEEVFSIRPIIRQKRYL